MDLARELMSGFNYYSKNFFNCDRCGNRYSYSGSYAKHNLHPTRCAACLAATDGRAEEKPSKANIYVDPVMDHGWRLGPSCHMTTDGSLEALHAFAVSIGLKREWFQPCPPSSIDHYDLTESRRRRAVELGAVELTRAQAVDHWKSQQRKRQGQELRTPTKFAIVQDDSTNH
jgi:hypothetical protein